MSRRRRRFALIRRHVPDRAFIVAASLRSASHAQSRPTAERTLDAIQPFCRLFPRCRAYSCGVPRHPLLIGRLHCARSSLKLSRARGVKRAAKLGNPFSTYTKKRDKKRPHRRRLQRTMYVSRGFRSVGTTTSISSGVHWAGRGRSQNHTYLDWCERRSSATIEVLVRRGRIFTGPGGGTHPRGSRNHSDIRG